MVREGACQVEPEKPQRGVEAECQTEPTPQLSCRFCGVDEHIVMEQITKKTPRRGEDANHPEMNNSVIDGEECKVAAQRVDARTTPAVNWEESSDIRVHNAASRNTPVDPMNTGVKVEADLVIFTVKEEQEEVGIYHEKSSIHSQTNVDPVNIGAGVEADIQVSLIKEEDIASCKAEINNIVIGDKSNLSVNSLPTTTSVKQEDGSESNISYNPGSVKRSWEQIKNKYKNIIQTGNRKKTAEELALSNNQGRPLMEGLDRGVSSDPGGAGSAQQGKFVQVDGETLLLLPPPTYIPLSHTEVVADNVRSLYKRTLELEIEYKKSVIKKVKLEVEKLEYEKKERENKMLLENKDL